VPYQWRPGWSGNVYGLGILRLQLAAYIRMISSAPAETVG
jgi:hypothetical protein